MDKCGVEPTVWNGGGSRKPNHWVNWCQVYTVNDTNVTENLIQICFIIRSIHAGNINTVSLSRGIHFVINFF